MSEYLEILTPPQLSYEKTARGTVDLLESLFDSFRKIVGGAWSVFFPRSGFSLITDASAQFWMACLYSSRTDEMVNGFVGLFLTPHRDRLQALNRGYVQQTGLHLRDAITEYLDNSKEKIAKLHEAVAESVKEGLDRSFAEMVRVINKLELPPLLIFYYQFLTQELCQAFANLDGDLSSKENRFIQKCSRGVSEEQERLHRPVSRLRRGLFLVARAQHRRRCLHEVRQDLQLRIRRVGALKVRNPCPLEKMKSGIQSDAICIRPRETVTSARSRPSS